MKEAERAVIEPAIPFNRPSLAGQELAYVRDAIERGHISGDGVYTRRSESMLSELLGGARVLLTTSCTHALEMSALLLDLQPGDEVIIPSFTFVSTASAFALRGARPVFIDIRPDTLNLDERLLPQLITPRTRAIVPVHYAGVGCELDTILDIARRNRINVIEDNAHGLFGQFRGRPLGTFGALSTLSFHETKNVSCGEGGALVINDPSLIARAEILREKGTDRSRFFRGEVDKYTWLDLGSSYVASDMLAAFLVAQLEAREKIQRARQRVWERYFDGIRDWAQQRGVQLPHVPEHCTQAWHLFHLLLPSLDERQAFIAHLRRRSVQAIFHYMPLHLSAMGERFGGRPGDCPVAESVSDRVVRLPLYPTLSEADQTRIIDAVCSF
ncbi:MAG TPA: dTDP-4-amino-4,6-dideoxygalactose transaminase [Thermoanaerobaculia bacterium]